MAWAVVEVVSGIELDLGLAIDLAIDLVLGLATGREADLDQA
jgi:hypothetical protein